MHQPVLLTAVIETIARTTAGRYIDGTVGAGGHSRAILQATNGTLLGFDQDPSALELARHHLSDFAEQVTLIQANFEQLTRYARRHGFTQVDGILLDVGVSSMQVDQATRGFSFQQNGPLDMRMNPDSDQTAADLVNHLAETDLADLIYQYGEERDSRRIARAIVAARPINETAALAEVVAKAKRKRGRSRIHPATQTFQALRIAVNDELGVLTRVLPQAIDLLQTGGRLGVIGFHSLEDRIVKQFFRQEANDCLCPSEQPVCTCDHQATIKLITRKPITADAAEIETNPRARSAKLRVVEKI